MKFFPHAVIRPVQQEFAQHVMDALEAKKDLLLDAPTGIGKTAGVLAPALEFAIDKGYTIFFLTSRHTQHKLVVETAKEIERKHGRKITVSDLLGKQHMCAQEGVDAFRGKEFIDYCKNLREKGNCHFYINFKQGNKPTIRAKKLIVDIKKNRPLHTEELVILSKANGMCPYEIAGQLASEANIVVCDYSLLFHPDMRLSLLNRMQKQLEHTIIIVDEAHNLAPRLRDMMSYKLSTFMIKRARQEAEKIGDDELVVRLNELNSILDKLGESFEKERVISKDQILEFADEDLDQFISNMHASAEI